MKILLLEDNVNFANLIKDVFFRNGYDVEHFVDGEDALENCCNGYDCFILDIHVPNIDGLTLLKEIRDRDKDTPAVIISANIELETIQKAYIAGCNDFLKKPFYMYELETKISLLCRENDKVKLLEKYVYDRSEETLYNEENKRISLTRKEKRMMSILTKTPNAMVSTDAINDYVWEGNIATVASLRSLIKRLRQKLPKDTIIRHNYGYECKTG